MRKQLLGFALIILAVLVCALFPSVPGAILHKILNFCQLGWEALKDNAWGFNPHHLAKAYLEGDALHRLFTGVIAIAFVLIAVIGIPHLLVNGTLLIRDLKKSKIRPWTRAFIERQNQSQIDYLHTLSEAEAEALGQGRDFTDSDTREVEGLLAQVRAKDRHWMEKWDRFFSREYHAIHSFPQALFHFVFSFSSMTNSAVVYSRVWNIWFALRSFFPLFHPILFVTLLLYPSFFSVAISREKKETLPSKWNGGLRSSARLLIFLLFQPRELMRLRNREKENSKGEALLWDFSVLASKSFHSDLKGFERWRYYRSVDEIHARAMKAWVGDGCPTLSDENAKTRVDAAISGYQPEVGIRLFSDFFRKMKYSVVESLSPKRSRQVEIIQVTERQLDNAKAMARAVRSMLASNLVDKPMELFFIFICYAGITEGILKPLQEQIFSENSWFYLSRYVFLNVFTYNVIAGIFSDTWLKIQQDTMNEGRFENAPSGENAKKSFLGWWTHETWMNPGNTWWHNQKYTVLNYILPVTKATFVTALVVNWITMGRLDLDSFTANTLVLIFFPFTGLSWKLEQGFELASAWVVRDIPERLRPHPLVQKYALTAIARRRIEFNLYYKMYENLTWNFMIAFMNMNTVLFGTRSFSRLVFFGYTPTELLANPARSLHAAALKISPILAWPFSALDHLLTNGYTDGTKLGPNGWD